MADEIEIGSKAIKQIQDLRAELVKLSQDVQAVNKNSINISTPGGLSKSGNDNAKALQDLESLKVKYVALNDTIVKKAEQSRLAEIKLQQQREKAFDSFERNAQKEAALNAKNETAYQRIQNSVATLTKTYQDLAIRKQLGSTLTAKEEAQLTSLTTRISTYQKALLATDATIGKNQRNVGNYASGYNALGNSINQLTREAPAFANSINTGFMALSNNFPALFDAINGIRQQNAALVAEGKPTTSLFKQLVSGLFSWQTLLSVGVTLLTLYGGKIIEWASSLSKGSDVVRSLKENQTSLNEAVQEGNKDASKEISQLDILYKTATNVALSTEQRQKAVNKLQKEYPSYFANISDEIIMNGKATKSYEALREAIFDSARAKAVQSKLEERASERLDKELVLREKISETEAKLAKQRANPKAFLGGEDNAEIFSAEQVTDNLEKNLSKRRKELEDYRKSALKEDDLLLKAKEKFERGSAVLEADRIKITEPKIKKEKQDKREKIEALNLEGIAVGTTIEQMDKYIKMLETELILNTGNETAYKNIKTALEQVKQAKTDLMTGGGDIMSTANIKEVSTAIEDVKTQLNDLQKNYLKSFVDEFASNSGFSETFKILNDEIDGFGENFSVTFNSIAESAQEAFNFIGGIGQQNFDNEKTRLQNQYDLAYSFANGNKEAQEKLAQDLEKSKKEIANREAKAKQKQAIFNIAIDTAQAIMGLWAKPGFPAAIPLAIAVGALGAVQIGLVAAQKIPQYWTGTDNAIGGLAWTQEKGQEIITDSKGNIKDFGDRKGARLTNLSKGDKVFNAELTKKMLSDEMWQDQLQSMLQGKGILMNSQSVSNGGATAQQIDAVMAKHFSRIALNSVSFDENGMRVWSERNGNRTISTANRVARTGIKV